MLCCHCEVQPPIPGTPTCRLCVWRLTRLVFFPEQFSVPEVDRMAASHSDVVTYAVSTGGQGRWVWIADDWPARRDARLLR